MTFQPMLPLSPKRPFHTSQLVPSMETLPTLEPAGEGGPEWLAQIMISAPLFWPVGLGLVSNQRS